jgi:hypothetical protein
MLVLFSDVDEDDAPTRIRVGSHVDLPKILLPYGERGVNQRDVTLPSQVHDRPLTLATGRAGDVYLCHPFLVHAAQTHHGREPRLLAQPGVPWKDGGHLEPPTPFQSPTQRRVSSRRPSPG